MVKEPGDGAFYNCKFDDVFDCKRLATGCMMIRVSLFEHLEQPWFKTTDIIGEAETDDFYFTRLVTDAGYRVVAHAGVLPVHWDVDRHIGYGIVANGSGKPEAKVLTMAQAMAANNGHS